MAWNVLVCNHLIDRPGLLSQLCDAVGQVHSFPPAEPPHPAFVDFPTNASNTVTE